MSTTIKTGWLTNHNGEKFAPKTLISQVQTSDGTLLEDKIQADLDTIKSEILENYTITVDDALSSESTNPVQNKVINTEFDIIITSMDALETAIDGKAASDHNHDDVYDAAGSANAALDSAKSYTDTAVSGLASTASVTNAINAHNTSTEAHNDIRILISDLSTKVNNFLDVDDTTTDQLSEVLAMIEANEGTIESLTSNKINVSDIIDNLTTASADKVLSANQGAVLKGLIDALQEVVNGKADASHSHSDATASTSGFMSATDKAKLDSITEAKVASWDAAVAQAHEHSNKTVIDGITAEDVATWNTVESKAAQTDVNAAIERIAQNETNIASLVSTVGSLSPITSEEVSALFA